MKLNLGFLLRVVIIILSILALIIAVWFVYFPSDIYYFTQPGPDVNSSLELLIIAVLYISISAWIIFGDKEVKHWEKRLLLFGMVSGLLLALFLAFAAWAPFFGSLPEQFPPTLLNNLTETTDYMLVIAAILFVAILSFIVVLRRKSIVEWMKSVQWVERG